MLDLNRLEVAAQHEGHVSRRLFLAYAASLAAIPSLGQCAVGMSASTKFADEPFRLGVASGDPTSNGMVLWTRLAPRPLDPDGGMKPVDAKVNWEVATDDAMRKVVSRGTAIASHKLHHSVHVEVNNLEPDRWYWYRFRAGNAESVVGRTRTMPAENASPSELRFAFASCQNFQSGWFTAYEHMAKDELDVVFHLGDYIYESAAAKDTKREIVRQHLGGETKTLADYRLRHSLYRTDPLLQAMHACCPWFVTWDDHEVSNDYTNDRSEREHESDPVKFLLRRTAAYQAYYENMPLRQTSLPKGPNMQIYRKQSFGRLAEFFVLDGRQYRTPQPNDDKRSPVNDAVRSAKNTMLGKPQFDWLTNSLAASQTTWNILANQVIMATVDEKPESEAMYSMDEWTGYLHERNALVQFINDRKVSNPVVLTGDNHANWVNDLRLNDLRAESPVVATEFVGTSITSGGNGSEGREKAALLMDKNPSVRWHNSERGYVRCTITPKDWRSEFRVVPDITKPNGPALTRAAFVVEAGKAGATPA